MKYLSLCTRLSLFFSSFFFTVVPFLIPFLRRNSVDSSEINAETFLPGFLPHQENRNCEVRIGILHYARIFYSFHPSSNDFCLRVRKPVRTVFGNVISCEFDSHFPSRGTGSLRRASCFSAFWIRSKILRTLYFTKFGSLVCYLAAGVHSSLRLAVTASRPATSRSSPLATPPTPSKAPCVLVTAPLGSPIDAAMVFDALEEMVGHGGLPYLQSFGGSPFSTAPTSMIAASKLVGQGNLQLNRRTVAFEQVGSFVSHVTVYRVPPYVSDESLLSVLLQ